MISKSNGRGKRRRSAVEKALDAVKEELGVVARGARRAIGKARARTASARSSAAAGGAAGR